MDFFTAMEVLSSGLTAERVRMNVTASNLANARTTRTAAGGPYKRQDPVFETAPLDDPNTFSATLDQALQGVQVSDVVQDQQPPRQVYDPAHPDADPKGYVAMPNVNNVEEMVNMITSARSYEAGVTALRSLVEMAQRALTLGK